MKTAQILLMVLLVTFIYTADAYSHGKRFYQGRCDWKTENNCNRTGSVRENLETIHGEVSSRELIASVRNKGNGVHLFINTDEGTLPVILGPEKYILTQPLNMDFGDFVEVTGTRIMYQGEDAFVAYQITVEDETLYLRDENGVPMWSRRGRRE